MSTGNVDHCSTGVKGHGRLGEIKGVASLTPQHLCLATLGDSPGTSAGKALRQTQPDGGGAWACQAPRGHRGRDACLEESTPRPRLHPEAQLQCGLRSSESLRLNPHYIRFYRARIFPSLTGTYRNNTQCPPGRNQSEKSHTLSNGCSEVVKRYYPKGKPTVDGQEAPSMASTPVHPGTFLPTIVCVVQARLEL